MKVLIMNREEIEKASENLFSDDVGVISITDPNWTFATLKNRPKHLLQLVFDDIDNDVFEDELGQTPTENERIAIEKKYNMLTDEQASQIATFYKKIKDDVHCVICQCEHGQSRSAAIAAAILEYENKTGISIFADDKYYPNKVVFRKIFVALSK